MGLTRDMAFRDDGTMFYTEKCRGLPGLMPSGGINALVGMGGVDGFATTP